MDLSHLGLDIDQRRCAEQLACILAAGRRGLDNRLGATLQANFRCSTEDRDRLGEAGVHVRLVKGVYVEPPEVALPYGEPTDVADLKLAHRLAADGARFSLATYDGVLREALLAALGRQQREAPSWGLP